MPKFSSRLRWSLDLNPVSKLLAAKQAAGHTLLDLTESNPTTAGLEMPRQEILEALADPRSLLYQPAASGLLSAREAVCEYYGGRVSPDRILLTTSTSEAYAYLFKLLTNPGDEVLTPRPSYPLFDFLAGLEMVDAVPYALDFHDLESQAGHRTRAVVVVNPNNPTGSFLKKEQLATLIAFCRQRDLAIVSDEVFSDYAFGPGETRVPSLVNVDEVLTFSMSGLSKIAGLPQMKLGWIVVSGPRDQRQAAMDRLELIADTYLSVGAPVQWAAPKLLAIGREIQKQIAQRTFDNLTGIRRALGADSPFRLHQPEGGWYAVIEAPRICSEEQWVLRLLEEDNVHVQPGFFYDFHREAYLIVSLLTRPDILAEGFGRLLRKSQCPS